MKLILDTHIILWMAAQSERLPMKILKELESSSNELWFSPISVWEIFLLAEKGRISLGTNIVKSIRDLFQTIPLKEASLTYEVAMQSRLISLPHQDPADRFLAATATVYNMTLVTADARILGSGAVPVLSAR